MNRVIRYQDAIVRNDHILLIHHYPQLLAVQKALGYI